MAKAAAFLFRVEPRDRVVRLRDEHVLDREVEASPQKGVPFSRYRAMEAVVSARLQYRWVEPRVCDDAVSAREPGGIADLRAEQGGKNVADAVDGGDLGEMV